MDTIEMYVWQTIQRNLFVSVGKVRAFTAELDY
jgi:hypothetical protein